MDRLEEKRQIGLVEDSVGNLIDSAADEVSSVVAKVTGGKAAGVSSVSVSSAAVTTPPLRTAIVSSAVLSSKTPIVPASSFTSTTSDAVITGAVKSDASSPIDSLITSSRLPSSTTLSTVTTSAETSLTSSAQTDAQGSVVYVTSVETVRATSSPSTTSLVDDTTLLETVFATTSATGGSAAAAESHSTTAGHSKGLSTAVIIAISVVGGVVVLAIGLFVIWKLQQKKSGGYDDDADGIKWPELNKHGESSSMPLPAKPTGGHGFETNALEIDEYDTYSAPVSYTNSVNDHYDGYGEELPPVPPLPPGYHMSHGSNSANAHYPGCGEHLHPVPPLPSMYHPDNGYDAYTRSTPPAIGGVTLERSQSSDGYPIADMHHVPLGGTGAFEVDQPEMMAMTGARYPRGDDNVSANLGRSGSGRFL
ncbi:hypothetical protein QFC22_000072 [Naganishia vaughanmartiniae]|uniref:Uncharacterized protein n=1 Tax=Naganishia vaughanmartiniae TaxID=1424756 RepID=A0ACC2XNB3_9TREE|nr:hypothetical protein QFC22_000072 [Naganishia vaughanmartiniae]